MLNAKALSEPVEKLVAAIEAAKNVLITAPGTADGDSLGSQLAMRRVLKQRYPKLDIWVINDEEIPPRYRFLPDIDHVHTPESCGDEILSQVFDVGIIVDGGVDRAGRVAPTFKKAKTRVLLDHHILSVKFDYEIRIVEPKASSTTEMIYHISQLTAFQTPVDSDFAQQVYLGLIFDTGFFRHANTTAEAMELGAKLIRCGFDFTRVGERGMLERSFDSLQLLAYTLSRAKLRGEGRVIWSKLTLKDLNAYRAAGDDREGIIDHLFLTHGIEVALLFFELPGDKTKISLRSLGHVDVAQFARSLTVRGGGHAKAAGANLDMKIEEALDFVLARLDAQLAEPLTKTP